jgi:hypothetical protein
MNVAGSISSTEDAMRKFVFFSLGGLALLAACSSAPRERTDYQVVPVEMLDIYGVYPLSNGDVLRISREGRRYWAEMRSTGRFEIVPVDSGVFVQEGGPVRLTFEPMAFATNVTISGMAMQPRP